MLDPIVETVGLFCPAVFKYFPLTLVLIVLVLTVFERSDFIFSRSMYVQNVHDLLHDYWRKASCDIRYCVLTVHDM